MQSIPARTETSPMPHHILIVDDERAIREELGEFFHSQGIAFALACDAVEALDLARDRDFDVILTDIRMPGMDGLELIERLRDLAPESQVLVMTGHPSVDTAVSALRLGAADYVTKPIVLEDLLHKVRRMIEFHAQTRELRWYRRQVAREHDFSNIIGRSDAMKQVFDLIQRVAATDSPVLITGESGTGKELVARAIHYNGARKEHRLVTMNCAAIPATLMDGQLFGHVRGAYTGADTASEGLFRAASGGTLVLDEIGDLPLELQPKLLRAVENGEVLPLGATEAVHVDTRIIASTHKNLEEEAAQGRFRNDLLYRLSVLTIHIPPLRDRREDITPLVEHFIQSLNKKLRRRINGVTNEALRQLMHFEWKGNVRELMNVLERAMILEDSDLITATVLPSTLATCSPTAPIPGSLNEAVRNFEQKYIQSILRATDGDKKRAAELLGFSLSSLYRRLQDFEQGHDSQSILGRGA